VGVEPEELEDDRQGEGRVVGKDVHVMYRCWLNKLTA